MDGRFITTDERVDLRETYEGVGVVQFDGPYNEAKDDAKAYCGECQLDLSDGDDYWKFCPGDLPCPPNVSQHKEICQELNALYERKNHDYGNSFSDTYKKLGIVSAVTRIYDKMNRLCSLSTKEQRVHDESIVDTLRDLANYAIMTIMELDKDARG